MEWGESPAVHILEVLLTHTHMLHTQKTPRNHGHLGTVKPNPRASTVSVSQPCTRSPSLFVDLGVAFGGPRKGESCPFALSSKPPKKGGRSKKTHPDSCEGPKTSSGIKKRCSFRTPAKYGGWTLLHHQKATPRDNDHLETLSFCRNAPSSMWKTAM